MTTMKCGKGKLLGFLRKKVLRYSTQCLIQTEDQEEQNMMYTELQQPTNQSGTDQASGKTASS